jgi:hypothetical protein
MRPAFAVAANFHLDGGWLDRLLVSEGAGWRAPREAELAGLVAEAPRTDGVAFLFVAPGHLRARFWTMLSQQAAEGSGDFIAFADDLRQLLVFKELPPPEDAMFELLVQDASGQVDATGLWALVNLGEEPVVLDWTDVRLRLSPGEGCRTPADLPPVIVPPTEEPNVLVAIRSGPAAE